jgi:hypothetical protein
VATLYCVEMSPFCPGNVRVFVRGVRGQSGVMGLLSP